MPSLASPSSPLALPRVRHRDPPWPAVTVGGFAVVSLLAGVVLAMEAEGAGIAIRAAALGILALTNGAIVLCAWSAMVRSRHAPRDAGHAEPLVVAGSVPASTPAAAATSAVSAAVASARDADRPRRARAYDAHLECLVQIADVLTAAPPSGFALQKALHSLETGLRAECVGLRLSPRARGALRCDSLLATRAIPIALAEDSTETVDASTVVRGYVTPDGRAVRCLTVPLRRQEETVAVLALQAMEPGRFNAEEVSVTRVAAMLMSLALSEVSRGREESRGALLEERAAIARELHDSLAQSLAFLKIQVAQLQVNLRQSPGGDGAVQAAAQVRQGVSSAYRQVKELIAAFRVRMSTRGLGQAIAEAVEEFGSKGGLVIELDDRLADCRLTVNEEFHLLQVIREALSNIVRHANARAVTVALSHTQGVVSAVIDDDGRGFPPEPSRPSHFGMAIMAERAASLGGALAVLPRPGGGTRVSLTFTPEAAAPERSARGL